MDNYYDISIHQTNFIKPLLFTTVLFSGLVAGLLYAYSCSVNLGLKSLPDAAYLKAMQSINAAIQNPLFFISFMGLLLLYPVSCWRLFLLPAGSPAYLMLAATVVYFILVLGTTIFGNVPLNEQLAKFDISSASPDALAAMRNAFEQPWNNYHLVRTIAAIISFGLAILSVMKHKS